MVSMADKIIDIATSFVASDKAAFPTLNFISGVLFWGVVMYVSVRYGLTA